jgi:predicted chitinase
MSITVTKDILKKAIAPLIKTTEHIEEIVEGFYTFFPKYEITTVKRIAAFLAQAAHETGGFKSFTEAGSKGYFDKYEPHTPLGKKLGNTEPGDGFKYRGRGIFQLTGRWNYKHYSELLGMDLVNNPDNASKPEIACHIACEYWKQNNLNTLADKEDTRAITTHIEGGDHDLDKRLKNYQLALATLNKDVV